MAPLIKADIARPDMESRMRKVLDRNASRIDRIRFRDDMKATQQRTLAMPKTTTLPQLLPTTTIAKDAKCGSCNSELKRFTKLHDWYMDTIDALQMRYQSKDGWLDWLKFCYLQKTLSRSMTSLAIHPAHIRMIKNLQKDEPEKPLIFVVKTQQPQIDLMLIRYTLHVNDVKLPMTIVNKRRVIDTQLTVAYEEVIESEIYEHLMASGSILLVYDDDNEDLAKALGASGFGLAKEAFIVPVSIGAEKIVNNVIPKWFSHDNMGIVKIDFHESYSLKDLLRSKHSARIEESVKLQIIADHLNFDIAKKGPLMSTNAVAFLLLTECRNGATVESLATKLDRLRGDRFSMVFAFEGEAEDIVDHALEILGTDLVEAEGDLIKPTTNIPNILKLSRYAEVLLPHFAFKSILVIAAQFLKRTKPFVDFNDLIVIATELCEILQFEITLKKPCEDFAGQLDYAFDRCSENGIMRKPAAKVYTESEQRALRMARQFESEDEYSDYDDGYRGRNPDSEVTINGEMTNEIDALVSVTMPILDAYYTAACCLRKHVGMKDIKKKSFVDTSVKMMSEELEDGNCKYWESVSESYVESCLKLFKSWNIVNVTGDMMHIKTDHKSKSIKSFIKKIEKFFP